MIRFGQMTEDEVFVTDTTRRGGRRDREYERDDPLVILKHFGPGNPDAEAGDMHAFRFARFGTEHRARKVTRLA